MEHSSTRPHELKPHRKMPVWSLNRLLLSLIGFYQRYLSPRKGWRCAYSKLHGGTGCSGFAREVIENYGWKKALPLVRQRFRDCHSAAHILRSHNQSLSFSEDGNGPLDPAAGPDQNPNPGPGRRNRGQSAGGNSGDSCEGCDALSDVSCWGANALSAVHFDACDLGSCHFGGCDGCSCDGCSCDGCS